MKICTHNGPFHADDVMASAVLCMLYSFDPAEIIIRSRDQKDWESSDFLIDVGMVYSPQLRKFDHHQRGGAGSRLVNGKMVPFSSVGLVWEHYGKALVSSIAKTSNYEIGKESVENATQYVLETLIAPIDAHDTGEQGDVDSLSVIISQSNPPDLPNMWGETTFNERFVEVVRMAIFILNNKIRHALATEVAKQTVIDAELNGSTVVLPYYCSGWNSVILSESRFDSAMFCTWPTVNGWSIFAISDGKNHERLLFPEEWRGKDKADLIALTGIEEITFVHNKGFCAGTTTQASAIALANIAVQK